MIPKFPEVCGVQEVLGNFPSCSPALALLADVYTAQVQASVAKEKMEAGRAISQLAVGCFRGLMVADPIRRYYWQFRIQAMDATLAASD